jgi:protein-L-isoaspartate O-methyltransferase
MSRLPDSYFERVYESGLDPWGFETRWYESRKYALTLAALPRPRYRRAFEPGCAIGVLTAQLAARCDALVAAEPMSAVAARARTRVAELPHVDVRELAIPDGWPEGRFDLVVLSEVVYYLDDGGVTELLARLDASLLPGGHLVAVHWTGATDYPLTGHAAHARLDAHASWHKLASYTEPEFLLATYERRVR